VPQVPARRNRLLLESSVLLSLVASGFAFEWPQISGEKDTAFLVLLIVPASATIAYLFVGALVPNLTALARFRWPLMVTLPIVYGALLQLCAALWLRGPNPLVRQELFSRASEFWHRVEPAGGLLLCQIAALSVWALLAARAGSAE
jgi:hypothetical protein